MSNVVRLERDSGVARITLARPLSGNALNLVLLEQLSHFIKEANCDDSCRVITISAEGTHFCQGIDLEETLRRALGDTRRALGDTRRALGDTRRALGDTRQALGDTRRALGDTLPNGGPPELALFNHTFIDCLTLIARSSRPVIACVEGKVTGGGLGLVAACDLVLATSNASFMLSEVIVGLIPALIAPFLRRRLSSARVRYMTLSSRAINADEAWQFGLVDEVAKEGMMRALDRQLKRLFRSNPSALAESKRYFAELDGTTLERQVEIALKHATSWLSQPEVVEGMQSFVDGFSPPWWQKYSKQ